MLSLTAIFACHHTSLVLRYSCWRNCLQCRRPQFDSWVRKIPWKKVRLPTPVFFPGEFHGQRSLEGYSPWGHKESDTTERLTVSHFTTFCFQISCHLYLCLNLPSSSPSWWIIISLVFTAFKLCSILQFSPKILFKNLICLKNNNSSPPLISYLLKILPFWSHFSLLIIKFI